MHKVAPLDRQLKERLLDIPEISLSGFQAREGLTGAGVTVLRGRTYFGSWRVTAGTLVWVNASIGEQDHFVENVDEAVRHTLLLILKNLQNTRSVRPARAMVG